MKTSRTFTTLIAAVILSGAASAWAITRNNYYHGSICQASQTGDATYTEQGIKATRNTQFICAAPWSSDSSMPQLQSFGFTVYGEASSPLPTCMMVMTTVTAGLTIFSADLTAIDPLNPTKVMLSGSQQPNNGHVMSNVRRAYLYCLDAPTNSTVDGFTLNTCFNSSLAPCLPS